MRMDPYQQHQIQLGNRPANHYWQVLDEKHWVQHRMPGKDSHGFVRSRAVQTLRYFQRAVIRRMRSKYPLPVPPALQAQANARRVRQEQSRA